MKRQNQLYSWAWDEGPLPPAPKDVASPRFDDSGLDFGSTPVFLPTPKPPPPPPGSVSIPLELPGAISLPDEVLDDDWDW